jgi:NADPH:quinone reductase-like Zn-dependent oxidoreductase
MKAVVRHRYGPPEVLRIDEVDKPQPGKDQVLVRVRACSVNPYDCFVSLAGVPYLARPGAGLFRPRDHRLGVDFAGTVEQVGGEVTRFRPGDDVFGFRSGAFAEYLCVRNAVAVKPANLTFDEAAAVPTAALTALQALRDKGRLRAGQRVLINGAAGGVGTLAVQLAKSYGAEVTGVCSTRNVDLVRSLGADHVVDYTSEDFTLGGQHYHVLIDNAGNRRWAECRRVLAPDGVWVMVGGSKANRWLGPVSHWLRTRTASLGASQTVVPLLSTISQTDLDTLRELAESGAFTPVVDRRYPLSEVTEAFRYVAGGHARGKVVLTV